MKEEFLAQLISFKVSLQSLKKDLNGLKTKSVAKKAIRQAADNVASMWVEKIRSQLEHKFKIERGTVEHTAEQVKRLHVLSRPNNLKSSYLKCVNNILKQFDDKFILPIKQTVPDTKNLLDLQNLIPGLTNADESAYLKEAIECAQSGHYRAAVVMGWCAGIDRLQKKIMLLGLNKFNATSKSLKNQTTGKFKRWNKEFNIASQAELQTIFDTDLIVILEGMELIDGNESERLETCFQYRNHSAHPGQAPIESAHVVAFFTDITKILLTNPKFAV